MATSFSCWLTDFWSLSCAACLQLRYAGGAAPARQRTMMAIRLAQLVQSRKDQRRSFRAPDLPICSRLGEVFFSPGTVPHGNAGAFGGTSAFAIDISRA